MIGTIMFWCFSGVLTSLIAIQTEEPPLTSLEDLNQMSGFKLIVFGGGSTNTRILKWAGNDTRNWKSYKQFIEPNLVKQAFTEKEYSKAKNPGVGVILEDFTIDIYFKKCKYLHTQAFVNF